MPYPFSAPTPQWGLANQANQFMNMQARTGLQQNLPLYGPLALQSSRNIQNWQQGQVPQDVQDMLRQRAAEYGQKIGSPGITNTAWLRALGLTSLGLQQQAEGFLTQAMQRTPVPELWNPMALYVPERKAYAELQAAKKPEPQNSLTHTIGTPGMWTGFTW